MSDKFVGYKKMKENIILRDATLSDAAGIAGLMGQLGYPGTPEEVKDRVISTEEMRFTVYRCAQAITMHTHEMSF